MHKTCFNIKSVTYTLLLLLLPFLSLAWNESGHNTAGAITYQYLKMHKPSAIDKVVNVLKQHPWYNTPRWQNKLAGLTTEQKNIALFMLASTFPDDARDDYSLGGGERTKWHYVDYPFVPDGSNVKGRQPDRPNAEEVLLRLSGSIKTERNPEQKAIDLCWLFHIIQDLHQPLHVASLFDERHRDGDKGGNHTYIIFNDAQRSVKLHSYWDRLVPGNFNNIPEKAKNLLQMPQYQEGKLAELKNNPGVKDWIIKESFVIAKEAAYNNGRINGTENNPSAVDNIYGKNARKTGERRIILAGMRVARELEKLF